MHTATGFRKRSYIGMLIGLTALTVTSTQVVAAERISLTRQDGQSVPALVYQNAGACQGVAIISHGAGGSEKGYVYLAEFMAKEGFLSVVPGHLESGRQSLREAKRGGSLQDGLTELVTDAPAYSARLMDIQAVRQWAAARCTGKRAVLLGHSMGAAVAMMEAGADNKMGVTGTASFDAYIALSPQGEGLIFPAHAWYKISKPVLLMTGTRDDDLAHASWRTRTEPFADMAPGCKWLGVVNGATHMNFGGNGLLHRTEGLTTQTIHAFLQGVQSGNCAAPPPLAGMELRTK
ncbi:alpha/beta hydrolase family protein [Undibacterium sp. WLX3042]|uniref:alpha/beta hydrolase family protein n=1 Tax=Undibacterium sp. WLX3042 TaxID=3412686 RepID=UPI003C2F7D58